MWCCPKDNDELKWCQIQNSLSSFLLLNLKFVLCLSFSLSLKNQTIFYLTEIFIKRSSNSQKSNIEFHEAKHFFFFFSFVFGTNSESKVSISKKNKKIDIKNRFLCDGYVWERERERERGKALMTALKSERENFSFDKEMLWVSFWNAESIVTLTKSWKKW